MSNLLIYGANGYTGELIAREAALRGLRPVLAGRNAAAIERLANELKFEARVFPLDDPAKLDAGLQGVQAVLHCAGPFSRTAEPMAEACLRQRVHYLDITGEAEVYLAMAGRDARARDAGVMLLPGVGFDVVPSDCLAAHLKRRLPTATKLILAFKALNGVSRGTATTMAENAYKGGLVRQNNELKRVPAAWKTREFDFGAGPQMTMTIPWGDVVTAWYSTAIPNIEVYLAAPRKMRTAAKVSRLFGWLLKSALVQNYLKKQIQSGPPGPTAEQRARGRSVFYGEVTDDAGHRAAARLTGPDGYTFTVLTALAIVQRVLNGEVKPGFQTPSLAFGCDFVVDLPGVTRNELP